MRISESIERLRAAKASSPADVADRLTDLAHFGPNPGNLRARTYVPDRLAAPAPLVVVLHGCTQNAAVYDHGSGWSRLADREGFVLLFPEQQRSNNPNLCFNWYEPEDTRRGAGEAASIAQMVERLSRDHPIDRSRVFVTGLSAGGAMTSVMLATYPDLFAGGGIIAGLPFGCAASLPEAFQCMGGRAQADSGGLGAKVLAASPHAGPWPVVSIWHGSADTIVTSRNGDDIVRQWTEVHGLPNKPSRTEQADGYPRRRWLGEDGRVLVEQYVITGMGHGTPLAPGQEAGQSGEAGAHMLDVAISSTDRLAAFWGIAKAVEAPARPAAQAKKLPPPLRPKGHRNADSVKVRPASGVQKTIEDALRAAGLMR